MKMIRYDGKSQQVDPERLGQSLSRIFNHDLAMIVILAADGIVTQRVAAKNHAIHHMHNRNFIRRKHFRSCHPRHHSAPNQNKSKQIKTGDPNHSSKFTADFQGKTVSPGFL